MPERTLRDGENSELRQDSVSQSATGMAQMPMLTADNLKGIASVEVRWLLCTNNNNNTVSRPRSVSLDLLTRALLPSEIKHPTPPDGDGRYGVQRRSGISGGGGGEDRQVDATILSPNGAHGPVATGADVRRVFRN